MVGNVHENLVKELAEVEPALFASNYPVFLPSEYADSLRLRLDSNVVFYEEKGADPGHIELTDRFAVKGGPPIGMRLGVWDELGGFRGAIQHAFKNITKIIMKIVMTMKALFKFQYCQRQLQDIFNFNPHENLMLSYQMSQVSSLKSQLPVIDKLEFYYQFVT